MKDTHPTDCGCAHCQNDRDFSLPEHLIEKILNDEVVLFAGSGVSTENKDHCKSTFYDEICAEIASIDTPAFSVLMDRYCAQPDGRIKLLEKIKRRFDYFSSFDDFYRPMTRFHRALSPLYMIRDIVTTNWDDFFERVCGIDAFVYDGDLAFWDASTRRLMKIHGSISNFGSIVATSKDYQRSFRRLNDGPLGAHLKSLIARRTVIYVGYSLSDENYLRLLKNIANMMGENARQSYFVAPMIDKVKLSRAPVPLVPIETDGAFFLETVRKILSETGQIIPEAAFDACDLFLGDIAEAHNKTADAFLRTKHPLLVFALSYQDGLIHALQRIARQKRTGEYHSHSRVHSMVHAYEHKVEMFRKERDLWNASYAMGYQTGLLMLLVNSDSDADVTPPMLDFPFSVGARSLSAVLRFPRSKVPRYAASQAKRMLRNSPRLGRDLIPDHTPYL